MGGNIKGSQAKVVGNHLYDQLRRYFPLGIGGNNIFQCFFCQSKGYVALVEARKGYDLGESSLQLTDVGLDVFFQAKCYRKFEEFKEKGKTILIVSHDLSSISKYCDKVVLLNKGTKVEEGNPKQIIDVYKKILANQFEEPQIETEGLEEETTQKVEKQDPETPKSAVIKNWNKPFALNPELLEYGNNVAEIIDFSIRDCEGNVTNLIEKDTEFQIYMKIQFHEEVKEPIFAYTIKDIRGTDLTGTNTMYEQAPVLPKKEGDIQKVIFRQKMTLQGGEYMLSLGCTGYREGNFEVFHRLYDVCNLTVMSQKNTIGFYDIHSTVILK